MVKTTCEEGCKSSLIHELRYVSFSSLNGRVLQRFLAAVLTSRSADIPTRQKYVNFVNSVKDSGGTAHIFSSMHVSGEREYIFFSLIYILVSTVLYL